MNNKFFLISVFSVHLGHSFNLQEPGPATFYLCVLMKIAVNWPCKAEKVILDLHKDSIVLL